ncbi:MAG: FkbM family methyltransferase [Chitinophagaceae bacterium]|nr:MAG: FkbM family methyltransferase [Chitinophagaceae bacterium]
MPLKRVCKGNEICGAGTVLLLNPILTPAGNSANAPPHAMKQALKQFLQRIGIYERLKWSPVFKVYQRLFQAIKQQASAREKAFYGSFLPPCTLIFDIGANDGHKTEAFLSLAETVVACEPDEKNFQTLRMRFYRQKRRVLLEQKAVGASSGRLPMQVHHPGSAFNTLNPRFKNITEADNEERWNEKIAFSSTVDVEVTTLDALIARYGRPQFIKIDVEGYELEVVRGLSNPVAFLSLECLFPEFRDELAESRALLRALDPNLQYNIALYEKLVYDHWLSDEELDRYLEFWNEPHFELIVRMPSAAEGS